MFDERNYLIVLTLFSVLQFSRLWKMEWIVKQQLSGDRELIIPITNTNTQSEDLYLPPGTLQPGDYHITAQVKLP